jgi:hypothetical protein
MRWLTSADVAWVCYRTASWCRGLKGTVRGRTLLTLRIEVPLPDISATRVCAAFPNLCCTELRWRNKPRRYYLVFASA